MSYGRGWLLLAGMVAAGLAMAGMRLDAQTAPAQAGHVLRANGDHFEMDGMPFQIISGAIHYPRVPRAYWRDRLKKARAMGLNTVETYVFWNLHEPEPGRYDFAGQNDVAEFIREAHDEGLFVILRPGPYVCAEWEFGGYPAWLLKEPGMVVRSADPAFMAATGRWLRRLGQELAPLQSARGGAIVAVQVENEYGSYGADHAYMEQIHRLILDAGFDRAMLYTADGADELKDGSLPELPAVINFGSGDARQEFAKLVKLRPQGPKMCGEYWDGWFDHWGAKHHTTDAKAEAAELKWMLEQGYSVNLYMAHGGTSFGWMAGANIDGGKYEPDVTSYDYDVPISENGELRPKFFLFRDAIKEATLVTPPEPPEPIVAHAMAGVKLEQGALLWDNLPRPVASEKILSMEDAGQSYGYILYRTALAPALGGALQLEELHSYAQVYLDGVLAGTLDRRLGESSLKIERSAKSRRLDILVENTGRVNFGRLLPGERAGITRRVTLNGDELKGWQLYPLPMAATSALKFTDARCAGPCFYRAAFQADKPTDTFIDTGALGKGEVFINGEPLGRFWKIGPQRTLYLPGPWLKAGPNEIVVFDLEGQAGRTIPFLDKAILDANGR